MNQTLRKTVRFGPVENRAGRGAVAWPNSNRAAVCRCAIGLRLEPSHLPSFQAEGIEQIIVAQAFRRPMWSKHRRGTGVARGPCLQIIRI